MTLELAKLIVTIAASIGIPLAVAYIANRYATAARERELAVRYVELSIKILGQPQTMDNRSIHEWALTILNKYAPVPLPEKLLEERDAVQHFQSVLRHNRELSRIFANPKQGPDASPQDEL